jgi:hypothetical protein
MQISVVNYDDGLSTLDLLTAIRAVNVQIERDFAPYWHMRAQLRLDAADPDRGVADLGGLKGDAIIYIVRDPEPRYLGFHQRHANGTPFGFVFRSVTPNWTVALSHEALELLADPECNLYCKGPHPDPAEQGREVLHWFEVCDAVQTESYLIDGIAVSNFVLPLYFTGGEELDGRNDFLGTRTENGRLRSFSANPGGYAGYCDPLEAGSSRQWFPDARAENNWAHKKERVPPVFRRADRREQPHPVVVGTRDPEAAPTSRSLTAPAPAPAHDECMVAGVEIRVAEDVGLDELERAMAEALDSPDFMMQRSEHDPHSYEVFGPAIEQRPSRAVWDAIARLEASGKPWLHYAEPLLEEQIGPAPIDPDIRAAGGPVNRVCACDIRRDHPDTDARDWALRYARVDEACELLAKRGIPRERAGEGVLIGHPDTGYTDYLKRAGRIAPGGRDYLRRNSDGRDPMPPGTWHPGHGTRTGSVLVGPVDETHGLCGVAPGARLVPYRITTSVVLGRGDLLAESLHAAVERRVDVISMSVGTALHPHKLQRAIARAYEANIILVAAAGNCVNKLGGKDGYVTFPARNHRCIACGAVDINSDLWCGSSNATSVDVYAPGESVWCFAPEGDENPGPERRHGTSFSCTFVAGVAALWIHWHGREKLLRHCSEEVRLGDLYRAVLSCTGSTPSFEPRYARILDAVAVLEVDLDAAEAAARRDAQGVVTRTMDRLRGLFPAMDEPEFDDRLASVLGVPRAELLAMAQANEAELECLLAHHTGLRAAMLGAANLGDEHRAAMIEPSDSWRGVMSERLRSRLG